MESINTDYLMRCIEALDRASKKIIKLSHDDYDYDIYRSACVKEFEIILELAGKMLKKVLRDYMQSHKSADQLYFKDIFRNAALHSIISIEESERWLEYRDNRNTTAHDYGESFADETLKILPDFIKDARSLVNSIKAHGS
jgi:nucleotidyltransferase substrate binding protein (TIGR01987 family)